MICGGERERNCIQLLWFPVLLAPSAIHSLWYHVCTLEQSQSSFIYYSWFCRSKCFDVYYSLAVTRLASGWICLCPCLLVQAHYVNLDLLIGVVFFLHLQLIWWGWVVVMMCSINQFSLPELSRMWQQISSQREPNPKHLMLLQEGDICPVCDESQNAFCGLIAAVLKI